MKKKSLKWFGMFVCMGAGIFSACNNGNHDGGKLPGMELSIEGLPDGGEMVWGDTLVLRGKTDMAGAVLEWKVNDEPAVRDSVLRFVGNESGDYTIRLTAIAGEVLKEADGKFHVSGKYKHGVFVLNEGNMTTENGSLIFIDRKGVLTDSVFWRENGEELGNSTQDLYIHDGRLYIIAQNGSGMGGNMLTVADAETLKKERAFDGELSGTLSWPTHIAVTGEDEIYIRDNKGVYFFVPSSGELTFIEGTGRAAKNRMAVVGKKVYAYSGKYIFVMEGTAPVDTIKMEGNISGLIKSSDGNLWVSMTTSPNKIAKVDPATLTVIQTNEVTEGSVSSGVFATPGITAKGDTLYFSGTRTVIYRHIFSQQKTEKLADVKDYIENAGMVYNAPAVDPETGWLYFNTIKGYGWDFLTNDITVFDFSGAETVLKHDYKNHTHFPAGIFFTSEFK